VQRHRPALPSDGALRGAFSGAGTLSARRAGVVPLLAAHDSSYATHAAWLWMRRDKRCMKRAGCLAPGVFPLRARGCA